MVGFNKDGTRKRRATRGLTSDDGDRVYRKQRPYVKMKPKPGDNPWPAQRRYWYRQIEKRLDKKGNGETLAQYLKARQRARERRAELKRDPRDYFIDGGYRDPDGQALLMLAARFGARAFKAVDVEDDESLDPFAVYDKPPNTAGRLLQRLVSRGLVGTYRLKRLGYSAGRARYAVENVGARREGKVE